MRLRTFRLRTLFIIITMCSILSAYVARERQICQRQHDAAANLLVLGVVIEPAPKESLRPEWLRIILGDDSLSLSRRAYGHISLFRDYSSDDGVFAHLSAFSNLEQLDVYYPGMPQRDLIHITSLKRLRTLDLSGTDISDDDLLLIARMDRLEKLSLARTSVTDRGMVTLRTLRHLRNLDLFMSDVTDNGVATLRNAIPGLQVTR